uniref:Uncharacterized protein n=2 Tax=Candidatus Bipolaricaulota TaxID=67810 RepID=H5SML5_9BACT|nr:hypothetical protein HGMM_F50D11C10 [uncultured Acetothermia bacterium]BAL59783.1 hypothetical protein HGMM_OP4C419 [Candidatus Acetothermum autotrophicum]
MKALRHYTQVTPDGTVRLPKLPFKKGTLVEVIVLPLEKHAEEWLQAAESSLDFWDNPIDDETWNNA